MYICMKNQIAGTRNFLISISAENGFLIIYTANRITKRRFSTWNVVVKAINQRA